MDEDGMWTSCMSREQGVLVLRIASFTLPTVMGGTASPIHPCGSPTSQLLGVHIKEILR